MLNNKHQKTKRSLLFLILAFLLSIASFSFASSPELNMELGIFLYQQGHYNEALHEFQAALECDPGNPQALKYIQKTERSLRPTETKAAKQPSKKHIQKTNQSQAVTNALDQLEQSYAAQKQNRLATSEKASQKKNTKAAISPTTQSQETKTVTTQNLEKTPKETLSEKPLLFASDEKDPQGQPPAVSIHGHLRMGFGYETSDGGDFIWERANFNLNEKNYRIISGSGLNNRENTFDPAIYDRLEFYIDAKPPETPFSFHTNIAFDPWSYVGKSDKIRVQGTDDWAEIQLFYSGNTAYTMGQYVNTSLKGDIIALPELKVVNGHVAATTLYGRTYDPWLPNEFALPDTKINTWFQPIRELWMDYEPNETIKLQIFPLGLEDKALTTDDPLRLSNNKTWWEESPWLASWKKGQYNPDVTDVWGFPTTPDFTKGEWDDTLAFATRDSEARRLTALRGISATFNKDDTEIEATIASPKTLWQDYDNVDALATSARAKQHLSDQFYIGTLANAHLGFFKQDIDSYNLVTAYDAGFMLSPGSKLSAEYAFSFTKQDLSNNTYESQMRGSGYDMQWISTSSALARADQDYFSIQPSQDESTFYKTILRMSRMDQGFRSSLSTYLETRDDEYWSRHITFREPMQFADGFGYEDIDPFRIGNGIDYDRYVINWRSDFSFWNEEIKALTDIRNVHQASTDKYVETVARTEWGWNPMDRLETKALLLAHHLPSTTEGYDPFIADAYGNPIDNDAIIGGEDASLYTGSLGLKYWLTQWLAWEGTWERTNDFTVATNNYPRGIFNELSVATYESYGNIYRKDYAFLYSQGYFPLPPYEYHNIFRTGLTFKPSEKWNVYLDYTRNPYEFAGPMDDNLNHVGLAVAYMPTSKLHMYMKYTWSRCHSINDLLNNNGQVKFESHHNVFFETQYLFKDDSRITGSFGVGPSLYSGYAASTPFAGSTTPTLDTQKIIRIFYTKNF